MKRAIFLALLTAGCSSTSESPVSSAYAAYEAGDFDRCIADCSAAIEAGLGEPGEMRFLRGKAYERKGELARAIADYNAARQQDPTRGEAVVRMTRCQIALGQLDAAEATIQDVIATAYDGLSLRDRMLARAVYGELHLAVGRPSKAVDELDAALKLAQSSRALASTPTTVVVFYNLSRAQFEVGAYRKARDAYQAYLEGLRQGGSDPAGDDLFTLGVLLFLCGDVRGCREIAAKLPVELKLRMESVLNGNAFSVRALYDPPPTERERSEESRR